MKVIYNPDGPATKRQLYALYCIYKKDYRNTNLSKGQADKMIKEHNKKQIQNALKKTSKVITPVNIEFEMHSYVKKHIEKVYKVIREQLNITSVLVAECSDEKPKKYAFYGSGCGFAWIEYSKRSKLAKLIRENNIINSVTGNVRDFIINHFFTKDQRKYFESVGCPVGAIISQDMQINIEIQLLIAEYLESKGIKNVYVRSRLD